MAVDYMFGYPQRCNMQEYEPKTGEGIDEGMFVEIDPVTKKLIKATGDAHTYAMLALTKQASGFMEQGGKIACVKENGSFWTSYYDGTVIPTLKPHSKLIISTTIDGSIGFDEDATTGIVGRFERIAVINGISMVGFTLTRS